MSNTGSFDEEINGVLFTFCPVSGEHPEAQITVMAEDFIFRMEHLEGTDRYGFQNKGSLPAHIQDLEPEISLILNRHLENKTI